MAAAKRVARAKARAHGAAVVHVCNTSWLGALGPPLHALVAEVGFSRTVISEKEHAPNMLANLV
jgi:hypothetical protein